MLIVIQQNIMLYITNVCYHALNAIKTSFELVHDKTNKTACASSEDSYQPEIPVCAPIG